MLRNLGYGKVWNPYSRFYANKKQYLNICIFGL